MARPIVNITRGVLSVYRSYDIREELKAAGCRWNPDSKTWQSDLEDRGRLLEIESLVISQGGDAYLLSRFLEGEDEPASTRFDPPAEQRAELLENFGLPLFPYQEVGALWARERPHALIGDSPGLGKAQPLSARILTPTGWSTMGEIGVGDRVIGSDGLSHEVLGVYPQGLRPTYRLTFNDGTTVEADEEHLWTVNISSRISNGYPWLTKTTKELATSVIDKSGKRQWRIPMLSNPVKYDDRSSLPLDPYIVGALIGDGCITKSVDFCSADPEVVDEIKRLLPAGASVSTRKAQYMYSIVSDVKYGRPAGSNPVLNALRDLELYGKKSEAKFIPESYLRSSVENRIALLQGLLDTDGYISKDGHIDYNTSSPQLALDFVDLVQGLGGVVRDRVKRTTHLPSHRLSVALPNEIPPFRLARRIERHIPRTKYKPSRSLVSVDFIGEEETQCISVAAPDRLYVTDNHILTHNTREGLAAVWDGERILIVSPAVVKSHWSREAAVGLSTEPVILAGKTSSAITPATRVVVVNYDIIASHANALSAWKPTHIILDEAHYIKTPQAQRTKAIQKIAKATSAKIIALTGTPINRPVELWPLLNIVGLAGKGNTVFGDWMEFTRKYCDRKLKGGYPDTSGASNLGELSVNLREHFMIRRFKEDVLTELPPKQHFVTHLDLDAAAKEYARLEKETAKSLSARTRAIMKERRISATKALEAASKEAESVSEISALRLAAGIAKLDAGTAFILEHLPSSGNKMVVFVHHQEVRVGLKERLDEAGVSWVEIAGDTKDDDRDAAIEEFQNGSAQVFIGTLAAATGITLTAANTLCFLEYQWSPTLIEQMADRIHRVGQKEQVSIWHLLSECAIDNHMFSTVQRKMMVAGLSLGDPRLTLGATKVDGGAAGSGAGAAGYMAALVRMVDKKVEIDLDEVAALENEDEASEL